MTPSTAEDVGVIVAKLTKAQRWVPGYEGRYFVDERAEVYSVARKFVRTNRGRAQAVRVPGRRLKQCLNRNGYPFVRLYAANKARTFEVHRLVCRAFHGEPAPGMEAAHCDGDRTHCAESNLRWKTRAENMADKRVHGTHLVGSAAPLARLTEQAAREICSSALSGESMRGLARKYRVSDRAVRKIKNGALWADATLQVRAALSSSLPEKDRNNG